MNENGREQLIVMMKNGSMNWKANDCDNVKARLDECAIIRNQTTVLIHIIQSVIACHSAIMLKTIIYKNGLLEFINRLFSLCCNSP